MEDCNKTRVEHLYYVLGLIGAEESVKYGEHIIDLLLVNRDPLDILQQRYHHHTEDKHNNNNNEGCTGIFIPSQRIYIS